MWWNKCESYELKMHSEIEWCCSSVYKMLWKTVNCNVNFKQISHKLNNRKSLLHEFKVLSVTRDRTERQKLHNSTPLQNKSIQYHFISTWNHVINRHSTDTQQPKHLHPPWGRSLHLFHPQAIVHHFYNILELSNCHLMGSFPPLKNWDCEMKHVFAMTVLPPQSQMYILA